jgi:diguanylate cyclase (GGDEF)-like protein
MAAPAALPAPPFDACDGVPRTIGRYRAQARAPTMAGMVMASWPERRGRAGNTSSAESRRRADLALHRAVRRAVQVAAPLLVGVYAVDNALDVAEYGLASAPRVWVDLAVVLVIITVEHMVRRHGWRAEPVIMSALLLVFASTAIEGRLGPQGTGAAVPYIAILIVASGLFLPWQPRWHAAWLAAVLALSTLVVLAAPTPSFGGDDPAGVLVALGAAALASGIGQVIARQRLRNMLEQQFELRRVSRYSVRQEARVEALNRELTRTARLDPVTGIGNRRALDETLASLAGRRLAAVLLDLDQFKAYNDRNGHLGGDAALARVGNILRATIREGDLVFRYGGEEFLILLPGGDLAAAMGLAERVRVAVEQDERTGPWGLTVSAGVAVADRFNSTNPTLLLRRADGALYRAKRLGRNRVVADGAASAQADMAAG